MEQKLVKKLKEIVATKYNGCVEIDFEGNPPVLDPESVRVDESGVTRFVGANPMECEAAETLFKWDELADIDVEFILERLETM